MLFSCCVIVNYVSDVIDRNTVHKMDYNSDISTLTAMFNSLFLLFFELTLIQYCPLSLCTMFTTSAERMKVDQVIWAGEEAGTYLHIHESTCANEVRVYGYIQAIQRHYFHWNFKCINIAIAMHPAFHLHCFLFNVRRI